MMRVRFFHAAMGVAVAAAVMGMAACGGSEQAPQNPAPGAAMTADTRAADEGGSWGARPGGGKGGGDKDAAKFASFYGENAVLMAPGMAAVKGRDAIQQAFAGL